MWRLKERTTDRPQKGFYMKPLLHFVSDNGPLFMICAVVISVSASLLLYTAAYLHA
jgi:hypothetical protein